MYISRAVLSYTQYIQQSIVNILYSRNRASKIIPK